LALQVVFNKRQRSTMILPTAHGPVIMKSHYATKRCQRYRANVHTAGQLTIFVLRGSEGNHRFTGFAQQALNLAALSRRMSATLLTTNKRPFFRPVHPRVSCEGGTLGAIIATSGPPFLPCCGILNAGVCAVGVERQVPLQSGRTVPRGAAVMSAESVSGGQIG
jgi:hypothetical protein